LKAAPLPVVVLFVRHDASLHSFETPALSGMFDVPVLGDNRSETAALTLFQTNSNQFKPIQTLEFFCF
jgi:hypothetical protein